MGIGRTSHTTMRSNLSPILEYVAKHAAEVDIIAMLAEFCLSNEEFESFDQYLIIGPVMILFHRCILENKGQVINWLMKNYYPLQVSYDNNVCYFHARHRGANKIAVSITQHHSFVPTKSILYLYLADTAYETGIYSKNKALDGNSRTYTGNTSTNLDIFCTWIRHPNVHPQIYKNADLLESHAAKKDIKQIKLFLLGIEEDNVYLQSRRERKGPIDPYAETDAMCEKIEQLPQYSELYPEKPCPPLTEIDVIYELPKAQPPTEIDVIYEQSQPQAQPLFQQPIWFSDSNSYVNYHRDVIDEAFSAPGLVQPGSNYSILEAYGTRDCASDGAKVESCGDHMGCSSNCCESDTFRAKAKALKPDIKVVYQILKAGELIPAYLVHIHADIISGLIGTEGEKVAGERFILEMYYEVLVELNTIDENPDIVDAVQLIKSDLPMSSHLQSIDVNLLRAAIEMPACDAEMIDSCEPVHIRPPTETSIMANTIRAYKHKLASIERRKKDRIIADAFGFFYHMQPLPPALQHIRTDLFELMMRTDAVRELGTLSISIQSPETTKVIAKAYQSMMMLDKTAVKHIDLLQKYYGHFVDTGMFPMIEGTDHELLSELAILIATHPEPNKQALITDKVFIITIIKAVEKDRYKLMADTDCEDATPEPISIADSITQIRESLYALRDNKAQF